jgi:hypothetical protein
MRSLDTKSLLIGAAVGFFLIPRLTSFVSSKTATTKAS